MPQARIYQPAKTAMQSGRRKTRQWVLEFEPTRGIVDPLMGWTGALDTHGEVRMHFDSREAAVAFAERHGIQAEVTDPRERRVRPKNYAANFRRDLWG